MEARIVSDLRERFYRAGWQRYNDLIDANRSKEVDIVAQHLCELLVQKLADNKTPPAFQTFASSDKEFAAHLVLGNKFYFALFSQAGIITEPASGDHVHPFTLAANSAYDDIFFDQHSRDGLHIVYDLIVDQIKTAIGEGLAQSGRLNNYAHWLLLSKTLRTHNNRKIYSAWEQALPAPLLLQELSKFAKAPAEAKLSEMAHLGFSPRDAAKATEHYMANLTRLSKSPPLEYIQEATRQSDQMHLAGTLSFQAGLLQKVGVVHWVHFLDSLRYPIVQDYLFLFIKEIDDYPAIIEAIISAECLFGRKEHLLLIALKNYFGFWKRSLGDLEGISEERASEEAQKPYVQEAQRLKEHFIKEAIPASFNRILELIITVDPVVVDEQFMAVFDWMNSHSKLYLNTPHRQYEADLIDLLNDLYAERLMKQKVDFHVVAESLSPKQVNWDCLRQLVGFALSAPSDTILRDKVYARYEAFISKPDFFYTLSQTALSEAINNAYCFSSLLATYDAPFEKWLALYDTYRTFYQGWVTNVWNDGQSSREAYLLCVGAGISYHHFNNGNREAGEHALTEALGITISQLRSRGRYGGTVGYDGALRFSAITVGRFCPEGADEFVLAVTDTIDSLKLILATVHELSQYHKAYQPSAAVKSSVLARIENEFWMIEQKYKAIPNGEYSHLVALKDEVVKVMKNPF